jgi:hypothetical protein
LDIALFPSHVSIGLARKSEAGRLLSDLRQMADLFPKQLPLSLRRRKDELP